MVNPSLYIIEFTREGGEGGVLLKVQVYKHVYFTSRDGNLFVIEQSFLQTMLSFVKKIYGRWINDLDHSE